MKYNYAFYWPNGEKPYFIRPSGQRITLEVSDFIPYIPLILWKILSRKLRFQLFVDKMFQNLVIPSLLESWTCPVQI